MAFAVANPPPPPSLSLSLRLSSAPNPPRYKVLTALWGDVLDAFAPESFVHIGGDEVWHTNTTSCWTANPQVQVR